MDIFNFRFFRSLWLPWRVEGQYTKEWIYLMRCVRLSVYHCFLYCFTSTTTFVFFLFIILLPPIFLLLPYFFLLFLFSSPFSLTSFSLLSFSLIFSPFLPSICLSIQLAQETAEVTMQIELNLIDKELHDVINDKNVSVNVKHLHTYTTHLRNDHARIALNNTL